MVICGHDFLKSPYEQKWEDVQTLKKHCIWYLETWKDWWNGLEYNKKDSHLDVLLQSDLTGDEKREKLRKFRAIIPHSTKVLAYIDSHTDKIISKMLTAYIYEHQAVRSQTKAAQMYLLYKDVLDKIKILEHERELLGGD